MTEQRITDAMVDAVARVIFDTMTGPAHDWDKIADPGRDLWRHNARCALEAAFAAAPAASHVSEDEPTEVERVIAEGLLFRPWLRDVSASELRGTIQGIAEAVAELGQGEKP